MKRFRKRRILFWVVSIWGILLLISQFLRPNLQPELSLSEWDHEIIADIDGPFVWVSPGGDIRIRDDRGGFFHTIEPSDLEQRTAFVARLLDSKTNYLLIGEDYGAIVVLALESEVPEMGCASVLINPKGLPSFEWLGNTLIDRSLRSVQLGGLWLFERTIPFSWLWSLEANRLQSVAALVAHGGFETILVNDALALPTLLVATSDGALDQTRAFDLILPRSQLVQPLALKIPQEEWETKFPKAYEVKDTSSFDLDQRKRFLARDQSFEGMTMWIAMLLIAVSTLISEDLACIGSGLLVSHGGIGLFAAVVACVIGIYVGDVAIYLIGRIFGERLLSHRPFRWMISRDSVIASEQWFQKKGALVILACRFMPGTRVPVYFAAGVLKSPFWMVSTVLAVAAILWVPLLVGLSSWIGDRMLVAYERYEQWVVWILIGAVVVIFTVVHRVVPLLTYRGRRLAYSSWKRLTRWEFWPAKMVYPPVLVYILILALKYRSLTLPTLSNPIMPCGGLIDESKLDILKRLQKAGAPVASFVEIPEDSAASEKVQIVKTALEDWDSDFPVVIKPDQGERGKGVCIVKSQTMLEEVLQNVEGKQIAQKYISGLEFGVLYWRLPERKEGEISSITRKLYTSVTGDGVSTLEQLILEDHRAVCSAATFLKTHAEELYQIPEMDEKVKLVEIGTHARGSLFLDACDLSTEALLTTFDRISHAVDGYYLGRFDLKVPNEESLKQGKGIEIVELNLLTSEPTHMYDPKHSVFEAWRLLMTQWRTAFEIGAQLRKRGMKPMGIVAFARLMWNHYTQ